MVYIVVLNDVFWLIGMVFFVEVLLFILFCAVESKNKSYWQSAVVNC